MNDWLQVTCIACTANSLAFALRKDYLSEAHRSALALADALDDRHSGCSLDPKGSLADRILVQFN